MKTSIQDFFSVFFLVCAVEGANLCSDFAARIHF